MNLAIGDLSRRTGVKIPTIRYYEEIGLLPAPPRSAGNRRLYDEAHLRRLGFVRHARELGFDIEAIRELLDLAGHPTRPCAKADEIATAHLADIDRKIARLTALRAEVARMTRCRNETVEQCRVIEVLADHDQCLADSHPAP